MIKKKPRKKGKYYCSECEKYYPHSKCKEQLEFDEISFLEAIWVTCPKGHKWIRGKIIDGKRWNEDRLRHQLLNKYARQVWKPYYPYIMRHWCATARCVEWLDDPRCLIRVKNWMGHKKINQTEKYIELADTYNNQNSWLPRALKLRKYKTKGECSVDNKMT